MAVSCPPYQQHWQQNSDGDSKAQDVEGVDRDFLDRLLYRDEGCTPDDDDQKQPEFSSTRLGNQSPALSGPADTLLSFRLPCYLATNPIDSQLNRIQDSPNRPPKQFSLALFAAVSGYPNLVGWRHSRFEVIGDRPEKFARFPYFFR